jgi:hypothetical protein
MMPAQQNLKEKDKIKNPKKNIKYEQSIHQQFCCFLSLVSIMQNLQLSSTNSAEDLVSRNRTLGLNKLCWGSGFHKLEEHEWAANPHCHHPI